MRFWPTLRDQEWSLDHLFAHIYPVSHGYLSIEHVQVALATERRAECMIYRV